MSEFLDNLEGVLTLTVRRKSDGATLHGSGAVDYSKITEDGVDGVLEAYNKALFHAMDQLTQQMGGTNDSVK